MSTKNLQIPGYVSLHQTRKNRRGGGLCIFLLESLSYKVRDDLAVNSSAIECLCVEVFNKDSKSIVLNLAYRPPNGDPNELENHFNNILLKREITNKELVLVGDFNINVLDFNESQMVQNFVNLMFRHGLIPTINKTTRVTKNTATAIDHIITILVINAEFKTGIINHLPIFFIFKCVVDSTESREEFIYKRNYSSYSTETLKQKLREVNWNEVIKSSNANELYAKFCEIFTSLYEECFPKFKIKLNQRKNLRPWITKGIKESSKRKQKFYEKFLKKRNVFNETAFNKTYKNLFEAIKSKAKKITTHKRYSNSNMT